MSGLVFYKTKQMQKLVDFYTKRIGMDIWLEQGGCTILQHGNFLMGFCQRDTVDQQGVVTFFFDTKEEVDRWYDGLQDIALDKPKTTPEYGIYHFFAKDPDDRMIEFQVFLNHLKPYLDGESLLKHRRSIRAYTDDIPSDETLDRIFESCRYSLTSRNTQGYYYIVIRNRAIIEKLSGIRPGASKPIGEAPLAVAVCVDASKTGRVVEDGCIAATYLLLSAWQNGLGTCWIADMDREQVKDMLGIPGEHYVATVTPLGYPDEHKSLPERREIADFVRTID